MPIFTTAIQHCAGILTRKVAQEKVGKKVITLQRKKSNLFIQWRHAPMHRKIPKHHKLPDLVNTFSKVAEYKLNMQKSAVFLYIISKKSEKDKKTVTFTIASKNNS